ncbi:MAG: ribosome maturation factor RimM [Gammaproteobacteria bacterium]
MTEPGPVRQEHDERRDGVHEPVIVGHVSGVHGVRGWIKVWSATSPRGRIVGYSPWRVGDGTDWREYEVMEGREQGATVVARLHGIDEREVARLLTGKTITVSREQLPAPEPGAYYWVDLIGLEVFNLAGLRLGKVSTLMETGAHDVLVVDDVSQQRLIPFVEGPYVKAVEPEQGRLLVDWEADF